jgi:hypothetical protein
MTMNNEHAKDSEVARAEREALGIEAAEQQAERRFDAVHAEFEAQGRRDDATNAPEFSEWMAARARTDAAWGRWAMAMDATRGLAESA